MRDIFRDAIAEEARQRIGGNGRLGCESPPDSFPAPKRCSVQETNFGEISPVPISALKWTDDEVWPWRGYLAIGHVTLLAGAPKSGKTTLLAHLLKLMADGGDLAGRVEPGKALVISEESAGLWSRRRDDLGLQDHIHLINRPFKSRPRIRDWEALIDGIAKRTRETYRVVVFDTVASLWPVQNENDAGEVTEAIIPLNAIAEEGAAVLLIHHCRKTDGFEGTAVRGSSAFTAAVDTIIELRRYSPESQDDRRRVLRGYGRFDETVGESVLELIDEGYVSAGNKADVSRSDRSIAIHELLPTDGSAYTTDEVRDAWPDELPKPGKRNIAYDLKDGARVNKWIQTGEGKKGDPFRYKSLSCTLDLLSARNE